MIVANKLGIAPQSISKWECGIGYPDVTLFPVIAELFEVPIAVLFGETSEENEMKTKIENERNFIFEPLNNIQIMLANQCQIEMIRDESDHSSLIVTGDAKFIEYFGVEKVEGTLYIYVKNPSGSIARWLPYDRGGYNRENKIRIYTGTKETFITLCNCLDLDLSDGLIGEETYKWICQKSEV